MLAIVAAIVLGLALILDLANVGLGSTIDLLTFVIAALLLIALHLGGVGSGLVRPQLRLVPQPPPPRRLTDTLRPVDPARLGDHGRPPRRRGRRRASSTARWRRADVPRASSAVVRPSTVAHSPRSSRSGRTWDSSARTATSAGTARPVSGWTSSSSSPERAARHVAARING